MRKRSKYRPKPVRVDALKWVVTGLQPVVLAEGPIRTLRLQGHVALDCLRRGMATLTEIEQLINASNMSLALMCKGLGQDWKDEIEAGADALFCIAERGISTERFIARGPELVAINTLMSVHDAQLDGATVRQFEEALQMEQEVYRTRRGRCIVAEGI